MDRKLIALAGCRGPWCVQSEKPDEIVGAAIWLAGDAASFTTGSVIRVDGGAGGVV